MSHHRVYHTEGFVISSFDTGESNKFFYIYTAKYGLIGATAQGIRLLKSKLRYNLQDFSYCHLSIVKGKNIWRITSSLQHEDSTRKIFLDKNKRLVLIRIFSLIRRLVHGEEQDEKLFLVLKNGYLFLQNDLLKEQDIRNLEIILVLQILNILGYLDVPMIYLPFIKSDMFSADLLSKIENIKSEAINVINTSLNSIDL